ncbi:uncharacterized protein LOC121397558 [Xenopus laevis]|uniref:Uncharacterized protein LOC121397558 n=1 Tax=Xenopus laevis TaxID=8355 RepID=A0A8J1LLC3_XENLA|nr:uncharacterized protein LOC121397558 [Xenopus laevis]
MMRVARIDSDPEQKKIDLEKMGLKFLERGYPQSLIRQTMDTVALMDREQLLQKKVHHVEGGDMKDMYYVSKFNPHSRDTKRAVMNYWEIVASDEVMGKRVPHRPRFSYSRNTNLKEHLSPSDPVGKYAQTPVQHFLTPRPGVYRCTGCVVCNTLILGTEFRHPRTGKSYKIRQRMTCTTTMVVYIIKCPCGLLYCGKTVRQLKERVSMHRASIRAALDTNRIIDPSKQDIAQQPVAKHWREAKHSPAQFKCMPIDHVPKPPRGGDIEKLLLKREAFWIFELDCVAPKGLNGQLQLNCFLT